MFFNDNELNLMKTCHQALMNYYKSFDFDTSILTDDHHHKYILDMFFLIKNEHKLYYLCGTRIKIYRINYDNFIKKVETNIQTFIKTYRKYYHTLLKCQWTSVDPQILKYLHNQSTIDFNSQYIK